METNTPSPTPTPPTSPNSPINPISPTFNEFQLIKRHFYALRNGLLGEQMRAAGTPYRIIFGLNLPQLKEVASGIVSRNPNPDERRDIALRLRENRSTRESLLTAPMIYPREQLTEDEAFQWALESLTEETADYLCFHLLRHLPFAPSLINRLLDYDPETAAGYKPAFHSATSIHLYTALRLTLNLLILGNLTPSQASEITDQATRLSISSPSIARLLRQLREETTQS